MDELALSQLKEGAQKELAAENYRYEDVVAALKEELRTSMMSQDGHDKRALSKQDLETIKQELLLEMRQNDYYGYGQPMQNRLAPSERRLLDAMKEELQADLKAQQIYQQQWQKSPNRHARKMVDDIMGDALEMGYTRAEVMAAINQLHNRGSWRYRINSALASPEGRGFKWGVGSALLLLFLLPSLGKSLRPITKWAVGESMELTDKIQKMAATVKEDIEDLVAEAQFDREKRVLDNEMKEPETEIPGES
jgi:hypothetical protein